MTKIGRFWWAIRAFLDDALPMPPRQRKERDWTALSDGEESEQRQQRLRLRMLEKRGKGGYR